MKYTIATMLLCAAAAHASPCATYDTWTGADKAKHFEAGALIGSAGTLASGDPLIGALAGVAVGLLKEARDTRTPGHQCSLQDAVATAAGALAGAYGTGWLVLPAQRGVTVAYLASW